MTERLSEQEQRVVRCISHGLTNEETAEELGISAHTVQTHLTRAFRKMGAKNRTHAMRRAFELGYLSVDVEFAPDWVLCPGETLAEWFQEMKLPKSIAWNIYGIPEHQLSELFAGREPLTPQLASRLEKMTGVSMSFWLRYETIYRNGLAAGLIHNHGSNKDEVC